MYQLIQTRLLIVLIIMINDGVHLVQSMQLGQSLLTSVKNKKTVNILVTMKNDKKQQESLPSLLASNFEHLSRPEKLTSLTMALQSQADVSQNQVLSFLKTSQTRSLAGSSSPMMMDVQSLWISNQIIVHGADEKTLQGLAAMAQIEDIEEEKFYHLNPFLVDQAEQMDVDDQMASFSMQTRGGNGVDWGVERIQAPLVWQQGYRGQGIRVGTIDTGVRWSHETLRGNYVGFIGDQKEYGWYEPKYRSQWPWDDNSHGTHVTAILGGQLGIGVAPHVKWMSCKGCYGTSCSSLDLAICLQFMICPTDAWGQNQNCSQAPHIVSNSWGGGQGDKYYSRYMDAMEQAGIIVLVAIGNNGPQCVTAMSPGDLPNVIGVGSSSMDDSVSYFSSLGPTVDGLLKPDITAPGHRINSAHNRDDRSYQHMSGTSMACPTAAGVVALMLSKNPTLSVKQVKQILFNTSDPTSYNEGMTCGGVDRNRYPNHHAGHGRINAFKAVQLVPAKY